MALKAVCLLDSRHKKRRPWTSLDDEVVGWGNLNRSFMLLINSINNRFVFWLEYRLEYLTKWHSVDPPPCF